MYEPAKRGKSNNFTKTTVQTQDTTKTRQSLRKRDVRSAYLKQIKNRHLSINFQTPNKFQLKLSITSHKINPRYFTNKLRTRLRIYMTPPIFYKFFFSKQDKRSKLHHGWDRRRRELIKNEQAWSCVTGNVLYDVTTSSCSRIHTPTWSRMSSHTWRSSLVYKQPQLNWFYENLKGRKDDHSHAFIMMLQLLLDRVVHEDYE